MTQVVVTEPPKKKRRVGVVVAIVIGVLVLLAGAYWAADVWARQQVAAYVTEKVQEVLKLDSDEAIDVDVAGFSVIAQVVTGSFEQISVDVDEVTIGDLTGGVALTAKGVPTDTSKPVDSVVLVFRVGESSIQSIAASLSANAIKSVAIVDDEVQFESTLALFGFSLDVGVGVQPFADEGQIAFTPTSVLINGQRAAASDLLERFGSLATNLLQTRSVCVARWLPAALTLDDVVISGKELVVTIGAKKAVFSEKSLSTLGTCPDGE